MPNGLYWFRWTDARWPGGQTWTVVLVTDDSDRNVMFFGDDAQFEMSYCQKNGEFGPQLVPPGE